MMATFNNEELLERIDHDWNFLAEMVQVLSSDGRELMVAMKAAADSGDAPALGRAGHTLKGMVSNFCATNAAEAARAVEEAGRSGHLAASGPAIAAAGDELERLIAALNEFLAARRQCAS